jgi:F-type H+-transporting ATPase subunit epsilon
MPDFFNYKIVTPEKIFLEGEASMIVVPGIEGDIGFLSNHSNIITSIRPGILKLDDATEKENSLFVEEGFVKFSNNELLIVAVGIDNKESINTDFINEKITKLSEELAHVEEYKKSKIQNKIDCLKLLLN